MKSNTAFGTLSTRLAWHVAPFILALTACLLAASAVHAQSQDSPQASTDRSTSAQQAASPAADSQQAESASTQQAPASPDTQSRAEQGAASTPAPKDAAADKPEPAATASYAALAELLANDKTRDKLIELLRAMEPETAEQQEKQPLENRLDDNAMAMSKRLAQQLEGFTTSVARDFSQTIDVISAFASGRAVPGSAVKQAGPALKMLLATLIVVLLAYAILRAIAKTGFARLNIWIKKDSARPANVPQDPAAEDRAGPGVLRLRNITLSRKLLGVIAALAIDIAATMLAALAGYIFALTLSEEIGSAVFALQFLNAFVIIEVVKAVSRGVFATRYDNLRLLPLSPEAANYWNHWLTRLIGLVGYALMVVVPVVSVMFLPSVAQIVGLLIMLGVYVYAVRVVWKNRKPVRAGLLRHADRTTVPLFGTLTRVFGRLWHLLAIAYFTVLLVVSQTDQQEALEFMAEATIQSALAIVIGLLLAAALTRSLSAHITLPARWTKAFPSLEMRINSYTPATLKTLRLLILIVVTLVVLDAWKAFDLTGWLSSENGRAAVTLVFRVLIVLAFSALTWTVLASVIENRLGSSGPKRATEREKTLLMLFRNAAAIVIVTMTILILLSQIGIDIGPLIAGAGIAGLAIGFGAQKLVQDVITGVFIQLENGMNQNDIVEVAGLFGTVEKITIRSVVVRTLDGGYHLIPFSVIDKVSNHTRDYGYHYGEYNIAHRESVDEAIKQLRLAFDDLKQDPDLAPEVLADIDIPGVTALNERGFTVRVLIKTTPGNQWAIQRGFNRLVKARFDAAGIELPYPQTVVHFGRDKTGYAAPIDVRGVDAVREVYGSAPPPGQTMRPQATPQNLGTKSEQGPEATSQLPPDDGSSTGAGAKPT